MGFGLTLPTSQELSYSNAGNWTEAASHPNTSAAGSSNFLQPGICNAGRWAGRTGKSGAYYKAAGMTGLEGKPSNQAHDWSESGMAVRTM